MWYQHATCWCIRRLTSLNRSFLKAWSGYQLERSAIKHSSALGCICGSWDVSLVHLVLGCLDWFIGRQWTNTSSSGCKNLREHNEYQDYQSLAPKRSWSIDLGLSRYDSIGLPTRILKSHPWKSSADKRHIPAFIPGAKNLLGLS